MHSIFVVLGFLCVACGAVTLTPVSYTGDGCSQGTVSFIGVNPDNATIVAQTSGNYYVGVWQTTSVCTFLFTVESNVTTTPFITRISGYPWPFGRDDSTATSRSCRNPPSVTTSVYVNSNNPIVQTRDIGVLWYQFSVRSYYFLNVQNGTNTVQIIIQLTWNGDHGCSTLQVQEVYFSTSSAAKVMPGYVLIVGWILGAVVGWFVSGRQR